MLCYLAGWSSVWQGTASAGWLPHVGHHVDNPWQVCSSLTDGYHIEPGKSRGDPGLLGSELRTSDMEIDPGRSSTSAHFEVGDL